MNKTTIKSFALSIGILALSFSACKKEETKTDTTVTPAAKSIYDIAKADTNFSILVAGIDKTGLKATLSGTGTFTVFAPTNSAFRKLGITVEEINSTTDAEEIAEIKNVILFHLHGAPEIIRRRIEARENHFMKPAMLDSQWAALEPPQNALSLDVADSTQTSVNKIRASLNL
jgi:hypothetical protein